MRQGGPIPEAPTEGGGGTGSGGVALSDAIGFVTDFSANVAIFEPLAATVLLGILEMMQLKPTIERNRKDLLSMRPDLTKVKKDIGLLQDEINSLRSRLNPVDGPSLRRPGDEGYSSDRRRPE